MEGSPSSIPTTIVDLPLESLQDITRFLSPGSIGRLDLAYAGSRALPPGDVRGLQRELRVPKDRVLELRDLLPFPNVTQVRGTIRLGTMEELGRASRQLRGSLSVLLERPRVELSELGSLSEALFVRLLLYPRSETSFTSRYLESFRSSQGSEFLFRYKDGSLSAFLNPGFLEDSLLWAVLEGMPITEVDLPMYYDPNLYPTDVQRSANSDVERVYDLLSTHKIQTLTCRTRGAPSLLDPDKFPYLTTVRIEEDPLSSRREVDAFTLFTGPNPHITTLLGIPVYNPFLSAADLEEDILPRVLFLYPNVQTLEVRLIFRFASARTLQNMAPVITNFVQKPGFSIVVEYTDYDTHQKMEVRYGGDVPSSS